MSDPGTPLLWATGVEGQRGERTLFSQLELRLHPGEVVWLRGRNGRGKTTLLRLLAGLSTPASGDITVAGHLRAGHDAPWRAHLLYIAHANALKDDLTATEALAFLAALHEQHPSGHALRDALKQLGVLHRARAPVRTLSQGQRRRVALARLALDLAENGRVQAHRAKVWLLDEPFDALDDTGIALLNGLISQHAATGGAVLLTSHQALSLPDPAVRTFWLDEFAGDAA